MTTTTCTARGPNLPCVLPPSGMAYADYTRCMFCREVITYVTHNPHIPNQLVNALRSPPGAAPTRSPWETSHSSGKASIVPSIWGEGSDNWDQIGLARDRETQAPYAPIWLARLG